MTFPIHSQLVESKDNLIPGKIDCKYFVLPFPIRPINDSLYGESPRRSVVRFKERSLNRFHQRLEFTTSLNISLVFFISDPLELL